MKPWINFPRILLRVGAVPDPTLQTEILSGCCNEHISGWHFQESLKSSDEACQKTQTQEPILYMSEGDLDLEQIKKHPQYTDFGSITDSRIWPIVSWEN